MKKIIIIIQCIFLLNILTSYSQDIPFTSDYIQNPIIQNPARAGKNNYFDTSKSKLFVSYRNYWLNFSKPSGLATVSFDIGVKNKPIGLGVSAYNQDLSMISRTGLGLAFAYHLHLNGKNHTLNKKQVYLLLGIQLNYLNQRLNLRNALVKHPDDQLLIKGNWNGNFLNFDFGTALNVDLVDTDKKKSKIVFDFSIGNLLNIASNGKGKSVFYDLDNGIGSNIFLSARWNYEVLVGVKNNAKSKVKTSFKEDNSNVGIDNDTVVNKSIFIGIEPIFSTLVNLRSVTNFDIGYSFFIKFKNESLFFGNILQMQTKANKDARFPLGINSFAGFGFAKNKVKVSLFYEVNPNYIELSGYSIGINASYRIIKY